MDGLNGKQSLQPLSTNTSHQPLLDSTQKIESPTTGIKTPFYNNSSEQTSNTHSLPSSQQQNFSMNKNMLYLQQQQQQQQQKKVNPFMMNLLYQNYSNLQNQNPNSNIQNNVGIINNNSPQNSNNTNNLNPHFGFQHPQNNYMNNSNSLMNSFNSFFNYHNQRIILSQQNYTSENLKSEYLVLKRLEHDNPQYIKDNLSKFENTILIPFYIQINRCVSSKRNMYTETYNKYRNVILNVLSKLKLEKSIVQAYGSIMNNFLIEDGDIDICIVPDNITIEQFSVHLNEIRNEITSKNIGVYALSHISPRYSLLKVIDNETGLTVDITVHTMLPLHNTKLIRLYSLYDQRFHLMGIYIKHWAKRNKLNGATDKFLSSYALLLMIIHFLQNEIRPSVLPILQKVQNKTINYTYSHSDAMLNCNVYFEEDMEKVKECMNVINNRTDNTDSAAELLVKFFEFYAYKYDHSFLISISNSEKKLSSSEHIAFPIEDPFDIEHNPGKSMKLNTPQYDLFLNCMKKEINTLLSGEYLNSFNTNNSHHNFNSSYNSD